MVRFETMTEPDFESYLEKAVASYAEEHIKAGNWTEENGYEKSAEQYRQLLPDGVDTENNYLFNIIAGGEKSGILWVRYDPENKQKKAFIYDIELVPSARGKGYGKAALLKLEEVMKEKGAKLIGLHVFSHNTTAVRLYEKLEYKPTDVVMVKEID